MARCRDGRCGRGGRRRGTAGQGSSDRGGKRVTQADLLEIIEKQNYRCALTGDPLKPDTASVDHIQPCSRGGKNVKRNIQILHKSVNKIKGAFNNKEFIEWCRKVWRYANERTRS